MLIGINEHHQIKQIHNITDETLTIIELDENSYIHPFKNYSDTKILCYCYDTTDGYVATYPYVPIAVIEQLDRQENKITNVSNEKDKLRVDMARSNTEMLEMMMMMMGGM